MRRIFLANATLVVCLLTASLASALPDFGEPQPVSEPQYGHNGANAYSPEVVANGDGRLVIWSYNVGALFAMPVGADGQPTQSEPILLANGALEHHEAASNGEDVVVVWQKRSNQEVDSIWMVVISDGAVQGEPRKLSGDTRIADEPDIAWNGSNFLVTWAETDEGSALDDVIGMRLGSDGQVVDGGRFEIWESTFRSGSPAVASNGDGFLVVWEGDDDRDRIHATRVSSDWEVLDAPAVPLPVDTSFPHAPTVASDGTDYLVAWTSGNNDVRDIAGVRVDSATGDPLDSEPLHISEDPHKERDPTVGFDGSRYVVVWQNNGEDREIRRAFMAHVASDGQVDPADGTQLSLNAADSSASPAVTVEDGGAFAVWIEARYAHRSVYGSRIAQDGTILDEDRLFLSPMPSPQRSPVVAASDDTFLVVWEEQLESAEGPAPTGRDIFGMRFDHDGTPLDAEPFAICRGDGAQYSPSVASDGDDFVVTWNESFALETRVAATQVRADSGEVVSPCGIRLPETVYPDSPRVASNGSGYLLSFQDEEPPLADISPSIYGVLIEPDPCGPLEFGEQQRISTYEGTQKTPVVASNGDGYLVAWDEEVGRPNYSEVFAARVAADGRVLDPGGVPVVERPDEQKYLAVTSAGRDYLVLWSDHNNVDRADIHSARFGSNGELFDADSIRLSDTRRGDYGPAATYDGQNYIIMWSRNALGLNAGNIVALSMAPDGELVDTLGGTEMELGTDPALATTSGGMSLAVWSDTPLERGLIPRTVVSPFGVDSDGDGLSDAVDDAPDVPAADDDPVDECEAGDDVGTDTGGDVAPDAGQPSDVDVWMPGDNSDSGCNCSSTGGAPPWGAALLVLFALGLGRVTRRM